MAVLALAVPWPRPSGPMAYTKKLFTAVILLNVILQSVIILNVFFSFIFILFNVFPP
jgi:hypothetical protein